MRLLIRLKLINELKLVIPPLQFIHCNLGQPKAISLKISLIVCNLYLKLAKTACECINVAFVCVCVCVCACACARACVCVCVFSESFQCH